MRASDRTALRRCAYAAVTVIAVIADPSEGWSKATRCVPVSVDQIAALFARWNEALRTSSPNNPDKVVQTYAPDAILLPTLENGPLIGRDAIRGYFVHFLEKHPDGAIDSRTIRIGCNMAFDAGLYTFTVDGDEPGKRVRLPARYTYVYRYRAETGRWLIVHHHSSTRPKPDATK